MGKVLSELSDDLIAWIGEQRVFFVATAPREGGRVNVSPKGYDTLRVLGPREVAYLDLTGSGVETIAHLRDDGRITLMFCAFEGPPRILRLYGRGEVLPRSDPGFEALRPRFGEHDGARAIVRIHIERVQTACGYSVPSMRFEAERPVLRDYYQRKGLDSLPGYRREKNAQSIDGLPGLRPEDERPEDERAEAEPAEDQPR